ncbi:hypothetical protein [Streptomyces aureus]
MILQQRGLATRSARAAKANGTGHLAHAEVHKPASRRRLDAGPREEWDEMCKEEFASENFSAHDRITLKLLDDPRFWRLRVIERIVISKAMWSERDREIHIKSLGEAGAAEEAPRSWNLERELDLLRKEVPGDFTGDGRVKLTLPITELPKVPLLDLHISVAEKQVYRLRLDDSARIQARYVRYLSEDIKKGLMGEDLERFLAALFYFPTQAYDEIWRAHSTRLRSDEYKVQKYLKGASLLPPGGGCKVYDEWVNLCDVSDRIVRDRAFREHSSGTQNPLIALPHYVRELTGGVPDEMKSIREDRIPSMLGSLREFLLAVEGSLAGEGEPQTSASKAANKVLDTYATCGYRWMAFAKCFVPLKDPFVIEAKEERSVYFACRRTKIFRTARKIPLGEYCGKTAWKMVSFADAETNHVSIRLADTSVRMVRNCEVFGAMGEEKAKEKRNAKQKEKGMEIDEEKKTFELYLRHSSLDRPERIWIKCHLRLPRVMSGFLYLAMFITAFAVGLLIARGVGEVPLSIENPGPVRVEKDYAHGLTSKDATLILIPAAFVASFLLVKDSSTLVMRIRRIRQAILVFEFFIMLALAFCLFAAREIWSSP